MILTATERGFYGAVIEPGQSFEAPDDFFVPTWAKKAKKGTEPDIEVPEQPVPGASVI